MFSLQSAGVSKHTYGQLSMRFLTPPHPPRKAVTTCTHQTGEEYAGDQRSRGGTGGWRVQVDGGRPLHCTCLIRLLEVEAIRLVHAPLPLANRSAPLRRLPARTDLIGALLLKTILQLIYTSRGS